MAYQFFVEIFLKLAYKLLEREGHCTFLLKNPFLVLINFFVLKTILHQNL